jgi:uncharacterized protein
MPSREQRNILWQRLDAPGWWRCLGAELELDEPKNKLARECIDIDIAATPFTNTLPIRRLELRKNQAADISALYIQVPDLAISGVRQRYRCLRELGAYTYQGLDGREYRVEVDAEGLVTEYEDIFKRVWDGA